MVTELIDHPLVQQHLSLLRDVKTESELFRQSCAALTRILVIEAARGLPTQRYELDTPMERTMGARIAGSVVFVPILRAGLGMLEPAMSTVPGSSVGYIGMERDETTAIASCYYAKMPDLKAAGRVFVIDPMLATGGSAVQCVDHLKEKGATRITMICIVAAPEGVACLQAAHPEVAIVTAAVDRALNEKKYILPGLGDFGDRLFNT